MNDTASAASLADVVNCSGGTFYVRWHGSVTIGHTITILQGTEVHVSGKGSEAEVNGDGNKRLFTVQDAVLHIDDLILSDGSATYGGAISATRSNLSLNHTSYINNIASSYGGAVYIGRSSTVAWNGQTTFTYNHSGRGGGAVVVSTRSTATWNGSTEFFNNTAAGDGGFGGGVYIHDHSWVSWDGLTSFSYNNVSLSGGGGYILAMELSLCLMGLHPLSRIPLLMGGRCTFVKTLA